MRFVIKCSRRDLLDGNDYIGNVHPLNTGGNWVSRDEATIFNSEAEARYVCDGSDIRTSVRLVPKKRDTLPCPPPDPEPDPEPEATTEEPNLGYEASDTPNQTVVYVMPSDGVDEPAERVSKQDRIAAAAGKRMVSDFVKCMAYDRLVELGAEYGAVVRSVVVIPRVTH